MELYLQSHIRLHGAVIN